MGRPVELRSDNTAQVAPELLEALAAAAHGSADAYGADALTERMRRQVGEVFEFPGVGVFPVVSGTAANALALSALCPPWGAVWCHSTAHIICNEAGATSLFSGGAQLQALSGAGSKLEARQLEQALAEAGWGDPHQSQPSVLSLTQPTDRGEVYGLDELRALTEVAKRRGLKVHVDGARFANAVVALKCSPAELSWKAGVDVLSLGAIKNGGLSADAIVCFDDDARAQLVFRAKRAGHVASKMRFQSAQLEAYLLADRWLRWAGHANQRMAELRKGLEQLGVRMLHPVQVNMAFTRVDAGPRARLEGAGLRFYTLPENVVRLVTSFATTAEDVALALEVWRSAAAAPP